MGSAGFSIIWRQKPKGRYQVRGTFAASFNPLADGVPISADLGGAYALKRAPLRAKGSRASAGRGAKKVGFKWNAAIEEVEFAVNRRGARLRKALGISRRHKRGQVTPLFTLILDQAIYQAPLTLKYRRLYSRTLKAPVTKGS